MRAKTQWMGILFLALCACSSKQTQQTNHTAKPVAHSKSPAPVVNTTTGKGKKAAPTRTVSDDTQTQYRNLVAAKKNIEALEFNLANEKNPALINETEQFKQRSTELIFNSMNTDELNKTSRNQDYPANIRAAAYYRLGEIYIDNHEQSLARESFANCISVGPQSEWSQPAKDLLEQLEAARRVEPKTIGIVLPMTGKYASISQKTLRGVQMGLGLYNNKPSSFKLAVVDSESRPDNARAGVERLVREDNVIAIIGSLLSKTASAVATKANELGVPSIALSQKSGLTEAGSTVFRNSLTSEMQVRYLVKVAMEQMGMKKFAVIYPNDQYGVEFTNIFWDEVLARGGKIVAAQTYSNKETDFRYPVQRLIGTYYLEARRDEFNAKYKEWSEQQKKSARSSTPDDLLNPITDFDAVFIPDNIKTMGQISAMLSYNGVKDIYLLGTNLWNTNGLAKRSGHFSDKTLFVDSFVSTDPNYSQSQFVKEYKTLFNEEPGIFEIQGYDSALLIRQMIMQGNTNRESLTRALSQLENFPGALSPLSITADREVMRPLVALTLEKEGNIIPLSLAPTETK